MGIKERPITFNCEMVKAIIEGRKTQTRRIVKPHKGFNQIDEIRDFSKNPPTIHHECGYYVDCDGDIRIRQCPFGKAGDFLWVRETFSSQAYGRNYGVEFFYNADKIDFPKERGVQLDLPEGVVDEKFRGMKLKKHPSIHMPRWASRITLEITGVKVERLQEITQEDAFEEGMTQKLANSMGWAVAESEEVFNFTQCRRTFWQYWDSIDKRYPWASNPWVWVIEFSRR
jgi:hypothetical protein